MECTLKKVEQKQLPAGATALLILPLGGGQLAGDGVIARYFARVAGTLPGPAQCALPTPCTSHQVRC